MKRFALFLGGLLVLPAFGEVAPVFYDDTIEYSDWVDGDAEYGFMESDIVSEFDESADSATDVQPAAKISRQPTTSRNIANRTTASRGTPAGASSVNTSGRGTSAGNSSRTVAARTSSAGNSSRATAARSTSARGLTSRTTSSTSSVGSTRTTTDAVAASRAAATRATGGASRGTATRTATAAAKSTTARTATTGATATAANRAATSRAARTQTAAKVYNLDTDGKLLYNPNDTSRVSVRTNATSRVPTIRMASMSGVSTSESTSVTATDTTQMDELAELTDYCKAQYASCMDNYCNILDDNQGRCSCSANLKNYAKTEEALKKATEELQEVAQKIQYIGLTPREVESLFTQTEAELQMEKTSDNSQLKTSLDKIRDMIIDAQSNPASSYTASSSGLSFDLSGLLDFTIDSTGFDLNSFLGGFLGNGSDVKNQRGADLYKTAAARCKASVLKSCTAQGVDSSIITNAYDLEIDRECLAYERELNDSNDQMSATVRNAKSVLQKARLLVAKSKNEYDMLGCINALDACMQDEFVCGTDYENCLDPSGRYIVNGEIVIGTDPGRAVNGIQDGTGVLNGDICSMNLYNVWNYGDNSKAGVTNSGQSDCKNAWNSYSLDADNGNLMDYINETIFTSQNEAKNGANSIGMSEYLQTKIGYNDGDRNYGMCISVLNRCQDYTYSGAVGKAKYKHDNDVVKQYLQRVMVQIKAKQDQILSDYAESCVTDVNTCLSQNNYPASREAEDWSDVQANIAVNACRSTIVTCMSVNGYSIDDPTPEDLYCWILGLKFNDNSCSRDPVTPTPDDETYTVNFDCWNEIGGSGSVDSITQSSPGADIILPAYECTMSGATQTGWRLPGIMGGEIKYAGDRIKPTSNVTVDAYYSNIAYPVTLNANGGNGGNQTLYFADNKWWKDSGKSQQISSVPTDMQQTRPGYVLRGYTNTKQTVVASYNGHGGSLENDIVIDKDYKFTSLGPENTIYAAWAYDCVDSEHCQITITAEGYVEYIHKGTCSNGWVSERSYNLTCATEGLVYKTISLDDNCQDFECTAADPQTIYYVTEVPSGSQYQVGKWYKAQPSASKTNPASDLITGITNPTSEYDCLGFWQILTGQSNRVIDSDGTILTSYVPTTDENLRAEWNRREFTYTCKNCDAYTGGTDYYASNTSVAATDKCGTNAKWTRCGDVYYENDGVATCTVGTSDMVAVASCTSGTPKNFTDGEVRLAP